MKMFLVGAAVLATMTAAAPAAHAQQQSGLVYGISGGLNMPIGSLGDVQGSGFNLQGHASLKPASLSIGLRGDLGFWTTGGKSINRLGVTAKTKGVNWFTVTANAIYNFDGAKDATFVPYVIGGAGFYSGSSGFGTKVGANAGGGVTFKLSSLDAFAEARIHNIFTDGGSSRIIPLTFGVNFKP